MVGFVFSWSPPYRQKGEKQCNVVGTYVVERKYEPNVLTCNEIVKLHRGGMGPPLQPRSIVRG